MELQIMEEYTKLILETISKTIEPLDLLIRIRHGEDLSDISEVIVVDLENIKKCRLEKINKEPIWAIFNVLALSYSAKGRQYGLDTEKAKGLDDIYYSIIKLFTP
jgi:hypothetical protein